MHKLKLHERAFAIAYLVIGFIFLAAAVALGIVFAVLRNTVDDASVYAVLAIAAGILALVIIIFGFVLLGRAIAINRNMNETNTLCHQTYGKAGNYTYFRAILNYQEGKPGETAAVNALGVASFIFLGVGFFRTKKAQRYIDVFVSDHDIVLNERNRNPKLYDNGFMGIPMQSIANILFSSTQEVVRVEIRLVDYQRLTLDIDVANETERATVYRMFQNLSALPL